VSVRLEANGCQLLFSTFQSATETIQVDLSGLRSRNRVVFASQLGFIKRQFPANKQVNSVSPDTLYFDFSKQTERKVPVRALHRLQFQKQYDIIDKLRISPEYVTITGPLDDVVQIEQWETDTIRAASVSGDLYTAVQL